jgi:hypothetical protein
MAAKTADELVYDFPESFFAGGQLPHRKRVDVDDADFFVGLDDAISDDAVLAARPAGRERATRSSYLASAAASDHAQQGDACDEWTNKH